MLGSTGSRICKNLLQQGKIRKFWLMAKLGQRLLSSPQTVKGRLSARPQHCTHSLYHVFNKQHVPNQAKSIKGGGIMRLQGRKGQEESNTSMAMCLLSLSPLSLRKTRVIPQNWGTMGIPVGVDRGTGPKGLQNTCWQSCFWFSLAQKQEEGVLE